MKVVLAADSTKHVETLLRMGIECTVVNPNMDETLVTGKRLPPMEVARALSAQKAVTVLKYYPSNMVLGLDTIISLEGELFGYPKFRAERRGRGVYTLSLYAKNGKCVGKSPDLSTAAAVLDLYRSIQKYARYAPVREQIGGYPKLS